MHRKYLTVLLLLCPITCSLAQEPVKSTEFATLQKIYQEQLAKIEEAHTAKPKAVLAEYAKELDGLEQALAKKSNLDGVMAVRQDKEDLKLANDIPDNVNDKTPAELKALKDKYKGLMAGVETGKKQEIAKLSTMYIGRLEKIKDALTQAMKIDDALVVKNEIDTVKGSVDIKAGETEKMPAIPVNKDIVKQSPETSNAFAKPDTTPISRRPQKPLKNFLVGTKWWWNGKDHNELIEFNNNGTVYHPEWNRRHLVVKWEVIDEDTVTITCMVRDPPPRGTVTFSQDREYFDGQNWDGRALNRSPRADKKR